MNGCRRVVVTHVCVLVIAVADLLLRSDASEAGLAFAVRACLRDAVAMAGRTLERSRFRSDGDAVHAREHALGQLGYGYYSQRMTRIFSNWMRYLVSQRCRLK